MHRVRLQILTNPIVVHRTLSSAFLGLSVVNFVGGPEKPRPFSSRALTFEGFGHTILLVGTAHAQHCLKEPITSFEQHDLSFIRKGGVLAPLLYSYL